MWSTILNYFNFTIKSQLILRLFILLQGYSLQSPNGQQPNGDNLDTVHEKQTKIKNITVR